MEAMGRLAYHDKWQEEAELCTYVEKHDIP